MLRVLLTILVVFLALAGAWVMQRDTQPIEAIDFAEISVTDEPDYYVEGESVSKQYDENGNLKYQLKTSKLLNYEKANTALLTHPEMIFFQQGDLPWQVSAEQGQVFVDIEAVELKENVIVKRLAEDRKKIKLVTEALMVYPKKEYAETDLPVVITTPFDKIDATGMKSYFKEQRIELLTDVRGRHEVRK